MSNEHRGAEEEVTGELLDVVFGGAGWGLVAGVAVGAVAARVVHPTVAVLVRTSTGVGYCLGQWAGRARDQLKTPVAEARTEYTAARGGPATTAPASKPALEFVVQHVTAHFPLHGGQ